MKTRKCIICGSEFTPLKGSNRKCCSKPCSNKSRANTNMLKYGCKTPSKRNDIRNRRLAEHKTLTKKLSMLPLYSKVDTVKRLNSTKYNYTKYFGKAKNRTIIKDDPILYKSLIYWSDIIIGNLIPQINLSLRLNIMGKYKGVISDELTCFCGRRLTYDNATQSFNRRFCSICKNTKISMEHFENKYGVDWLDKYNIYIKARYDAYFNAMKNGHFKPPIGKNETKLLDEQEKVDNCIIKRSYRVLNYLVDGYCKKTNTVYEVYEYDHKKNKKRDKERLRKIVEELNCDVQIIFDGWNGYDDWY